MQRHLDQTLFTPGDPGAADKRWIDIHTSFTMRQVACRAVRLTLVNLSPEIVDLSVSATEVLGRTEFYELQFGWRREATRSCHVDILPEMLDCIGRDDCMLDIRAQKRVQQLFVSNAVLLVQPQCFEQMVGFGFIIRVKVLHPLASRGDHCVRIAPAQFDSGPVTNAVDWVFEIFQQCRDGLTMNLDGLL